VGKKKQDESPWARAKRFCRLDARQIEMERRLGLNPKRLPSLVPSASQRWKLPVGAFIEQCYVKRFPNEGSLERAVRDVDGLLRLINPAGDRTDSYTSAAENLVLFLAAALHDLEGELQQGRVEPETLARIRDGLRRQADEIVLEDEHAESIDDDVPF